MRAVVVGVVCAVIAVIVFGRLNAQVDRDEFGAPPLMRAAAIGSAVQVRELLKSGADANATSPSGATALMWATGNLARVRPPAIFRNRVSTREGSIHVGVRYGVGGTCVGLRVLGMQVDAPRALRALR